MIHVLLNDGMKIKKGDEGYIPNRNIWEVLDFNILSEHDIDVINYSKLRPVRRLIKTHEEFEAFWQEAIG